MFKALLLFTAITIYEKRKLILGVIILGLVVAAVILNAQHHWIRYSIINQ